MSHFSVLVIGDNVESQLAPYHEFECTGRNDEFVQDVDRTEEIQDNVDRTLKELHEKAGGGDTVVAIDMMAVITDALSSYGLEDHIVTDESQVQTGAGGDPDADAPHKWGYAIVRDNKLVKAVCRTNPGKKWDWYVVGGRWSGSLGSRSWTNKDEPDDVTRADIAKKGDIDFDGMRDEDGTAAAKLYDAAFPGVTGATWDTWDVVRERHVPNIDVAREAYHSQPALAAVKENLKGKCGFFFSYDELLVGREAYVQAARDAAISTYAVVKDGKWFQRGEMGWFGMSSDEMTQADWSRKFSELLDGLPDDTLLTVVDCHI